jgi:hypothetical protein
MDAVEWVAVIAELPRTARAADARADESRARAWNSRTRTCDPSAWCSALLHERLGAAGWPAGLSGRSFRAARVMLRIVLLRRGERWHRERQHRGNSDYAQHSDLSIFELRRICRRRYYQDSRGGVTHIARPEG